MFTNNTLANLVNNNAVGITLSDILKVTRTVSFGTSRSGNGSRITTNGNLTLVSTETATASVGIVDRGNSIVGNVNVERFISFGGKWRLLSIPTNSTQTFKQAWQEGATSTTTNIPNPNPGYGAIIGDNNSATWAANGFDLRSPGGPTVKTFNGSTNTYVGISSTNNAIKTDGGYFVYTRGDRSNGISSTTLRTKGQLYTGTQTIEVPANQFKLIGNPFASQINLENVAMTGIQDVVYVWDPKAAGGYSLGAFQTLAKDPETGKYLISPGEGSYGPSLSEVNTIESGQAFFVRGGATQGSIQFTETSKQSGSRLVSRNPSFNNTRLRANLYTGVTLIDAAVVNFNEIYSNGADQYDLLKMTNGSENVSINNQNRLLVFDRRSDFNTKDTVQINLTGVRAQAYKWMIKAEGLDSAGRVAFLKDAFTNTLTPLNLNGETEYNFSVNSTAGTYAANRFSIVYEQTLVLPVTITTVAASRVVSKQNEVSVSWKVESETNMNNYEVEYSADGSNFSSIATIAPNSNNGAGSYSFLNNKATAAEHFYRIKANSIGGQVQYSAIVKVAGIKISKQANISVYPNPVANKQMNVQFNNQAIGNYGVRLINNIGATVYENNVTVNSSNLVRTMPLHNNTAAGTYQLIITDASGKTHAQAVIVL
jgi:hypothetical protein